ncbi:MAG: type I glyceraldehyde-3-phosphate dehydrogenase [Candidatus Portnoybacteria bacterium]|nr:type I glyceraldehyde-3-phosphate dehydrogenase [Candidatus Portnoybacteria bacterium]
MNNKPKIAINGFGRIGRLLFRQAFDKFDFVAVNDLGDINNAAYLLKYDTVYRTFEKPVSVVSEGGKNYLQVDSKKVMVLQEKEPSLLPWKDLNIDVAVEATGVFESFEKASAHLQAGAKKVVITAPAKDEERDDAKTVLLGLNEDQFKVCKITANGSCTTNATHPVAAIMHEAIGVKKAMLNSIHGYTATQGLVDGVVGGRSKDYRRGRAAAMNIVPATSGVTISVTRVLKALEGKFDGMAMRIPVITGSLADFTFVAARPTSVEEINDIFRKAAQDPRWKETVAVVEDPIVSSDVIGMPYGAIIDLSFTRVADGDLVKVFAWYDNEWGYVTTLIKHIQKAAETL